MRPPSCTSPASITTSGARPGRAGVSCTAPRASIAIRATQNTERKIAVTVAIERLTDLQPERLAPLIAESEQQGLRLVRRLADEWASGANRFDRPGEALFVARSGERVVGVCGLNVDPYAAQPSVGRLRHLYVLSAHRRLGIGEQLVTRVIETARGRFERLRLSTSNPEAARLYERLGFRPRADGAHCTHSLDMTREMKAAERLHVTVPSVSLQIRQLEREHGVSRLP